jgi:hypothetical protein
MFVGQNVSIIKARILSQIFYDVKKEYSKDILKCLISNSSKIIEFMHVQIFTTRSFKIIDKETYDGNKYYILQ